MPDRLIRVEHLRKVYGSGPSAVEALVDVSLTVRRGEFVSIMGASGSGKSTLLHVLGCLHRPTSGEYELDGIRAESLSDRELSSVRNSKIGIVFQQYNLLPGENIVENVALPLVYAGVARAEREARAAVALAKVGLAGRLRHRPGELSGGEEQRVAVARAIVSDPAILLADEPTGSLDSETGTGIMTLFSGLNAAGRTIVQVTHDRDKAEYSDRIVTLRDGRLDREEILGEKRRRPAG